MSKRKTLLLNLTLALVGVLVAFLVVEFALRLNGITGSQDRLTVYEFDDTLGWTTKKSTKYFRSTGAYAHFNYYNAQGLPVSQADWDRPASTETPSIAFIGDSFVEGYYLPYESTFTYLIGQQLPSRQVLNFGVSGYSPDQYLLSARRHLGQYNVTAIVVMLFSGNDLTFLSSSDMNGYAKPLFGDSLNEPVNTPLLNARSQGDGGGFFQSIESLADRLATFRVLKPILGNLGQLVGLGATYSPTPEMHNEADMRKALLLINQIKAEFPVEPFIVYFVPLQEETDEPDIYQHNLSLFKDICRELSVDCATPEGVFQQTDPDQVYTPAEGHFSALGASLIADDILGILQQGSGAVGARSAETP